MEEQASVACYPRQQCQARVADWLASRIPSILGPFLPRWVAADFLVALNVGWIVDLCGAASIQVPCAEPFFRPSILSAVPSGAYVTCSARAVKQLHIVIISGPCRCTGSCPARSVLIWRAQKRVRKYRLDLKAAASRDGPTPSPLPWPCQQAAQRPAAYNTAMALPQWFNPITWGLVLFWCASASTTPSHDVKPRMRMLPGLIYIPAQHHACVLTSLCGCRYFSNIGA